LARTVVWSATTGTEVTWLLTWLLIWLALSLPAAVAVGKLLRRCNGEADVARSRGFQDQSHDWQRLAAVPAEQFETELADPTREADGRAGIIRPGQGFGLVPR